MRRVLTRWCCQPARGARALLTSRCRAGVPPLLERVPASAPAEHRTRGAGIAGPTRPAGRMRAWPATSSCPVLILMQETGMHWGRLRATQAHGSHGWPPHSTQAQAAWHRATRSFPTAGRMAASEVLHGGLQQRCPLRTVSACLDAAPVPAGQLLPISMLGRAGGERTLEQGRHAQPHTFPGGRRPRQPRHPRRHSSHCTEGEQGPQTCAPGPRPTGPVGAPGVRPAAGGLGPARAHQ